MTGVLKVMLKCNPLHMGERFVKKSKISRLSEKSLQTSSDRSKTLPLDTSTSMSSRVERLRITLNNLKIRREISRHYAPISMDSNPPKPVLTATLARLNRTISRKERALNALLQQMPQQQRQQEQASLHSLDLEKQKRKR